jgi:hypothetical protein
LVPKKAKQSAASKLFQLSIKTAKRKRMRNRERDPRVAVLTGSELEELKLEEMPFLSNL